MREDARMVVTREYVEIPVDGAADAHVRGRAARGRSASRRRLLHRHLPAHRAVAALGGAARRLRLRRRGARDLPPHRAGRDRARVRRRGQGARTGRRRRDDGGGLRRRRRRRARLARRSTRTARSAPPVTAPAGTSRSAPRSAHRSAPPRAGTRPGCTTASSARTPTPARSRARREIEGELLTIWGTKDPHTPETAREVIKAGLDPLATRLSVARVRRRARVRPRRRRPLRPRGHRRGVRGDDRAVPAGAVGASAGANVNGGWVGRVSGPHRRVSAP